jgi:hypothetical protein
MQKTKAQKIKGRTHDTTSGYEWYRIVDTQAQHY